MTETTEQTGSITVETWDEQDTMPSRWWACAESIPTVTAARQWIKSNLKPGDRFRIIDVKQAGTVVGRSDVIVAD